VVGGTCGVFLILLCDWQKDIVAWSKVDQLNLDKGLGGIWEVGEGLGRHLGRGNIREGEKKKGVI